MYNRAVNITIILCTTLIKMLKNKIEYLIACLLFFYSFQARGEGGGGGGIGHNIHANVR